MTISDLGSRQWEAESTETAQRREGKRKHEKNLEVKGGM